MGMAYVSGSTRMQAYGSGPFMCALWLQQQQLWEVVADVVTWRDENWRIQCVHGRVKSSTFFHLRSVPNCQPKQQRGYSIVAVSMESQWPLAVKLRNVGRHPVMPMC